MLVLRPKRNVMSCTTTTVLEAFPAQTVCTKYDHRYNSGMTQKIAISLPDEQVDAIHRAVDAGRARSVSGFVSAAIARADQEDSLARLLDDLDRELGEVSEADLQWADKALGLG